MEAHRSVALGLISLGGDLFFCGGSKEEFIVDVVRSYFEDRKAFNTHLSKQVRDSCDDDAVKKFADAASRDDVDLVNDVLSAVEQTHSKHIYQV
jgi:hypothetical protein